MKKILKYLVIIFIMCFIFKENINAIPNFWDKNCDKKYKIEDLKICTYTNSVNKYQTMYAQITPENRIRAGHDAGGEVWNWTDNYGEQYWDSNFNSKIDEMKPVYLKTGECLPVLIDTRKKIYLSTWTDLTKVYEKLGGKPDVYYLESLDAKTKYTCEYTRKLFETNEEHIFSVNYSENWQMLSVEKYGSITNVGYASSFPYVSPSTISSQITGSSINNCPVLYACETEHKGKQLYSITGKPAVSFYNDKSFIGFDRITDDKCESYICTGGEKCSLEQSKADAEEGICFVYDLYMDVGDEKNESIKSLANKYGKCLEEKNCTTKQRVEYLNSYNERLDLLKSYCNSYISNNNYDETDTGCMKKCLNLHRNIYDLEKEVGIVRMVESDCPISSSIIGFVYNILKWAKYIVPALVIILSMLDFIKAIASQSEDDMKKAQGKFIKRLIAAALLFLGPLIINFMLKTFGLYSSKCDVFNLFS